MTTKHVQKKTVCVVIELDHINVAQDLIIHKETVSKNMKRSQMDSQQGNVSTVSARTSDPLMLRLIPVLLPHVGRYFLETDQNSTLKVTATYLYTVYNEYNLSFLCVLLGSIWT